MARIRTIKPEFWTSVQVAECSPNARLLFIGLWTFSDDGGNHVANPRRLKMEIFPGDLFTVEEITGWMDELITHGLVVVYMVDNQCYWHVTGWDKHQKIEKPSYRCPKFAEHSPNTRRTLADGHPPEWNGKEGNVVSTEDVDTSSFFREEKLVDACGKVDNSPEMTGKAALEADMSNLTGCGYSVDNSVTLENRGENEKQNLESGIVLPFPPVNAGVG